MAVPVTSFVIWVVIPMTAVGPVATVSVLPVLLRLGLLLHDSHLCQQLSSLGGILHHCLVCLLLLPLDRHERVFSDFARRVSRRCHDRDGPGCLVCRSCRLLDLLHVVATKDGIDSSLAEQEGLAGVFISSAIVGALVHPVYTVDSLLSSGSLELFLRLLDLSLAADFLESGFGEFPLLQCCLLSIVDTPLVGHQLGMP